MGFKFWGQEEQIPQVLMTTVNPPLLSSDTREVRAQHNLMVIGSTYTPYSRRLRPVHMRFHTKLTPYLILEEVISIICVADSY